MLDGLTTFLHNAEGLGSTSFFFFLLVLFIGMGFWSGTTKMRLNPVLAGPSLHHVFFGLHVRVEHPDTGSAPEFFGHIIGMNPSFVTLLTPFFIPKGATLQLTLTDLPGFPPADGPYVVRLNQSRVQRGQPPSYQATADFVGLTRAQRVPLTEFLHELARQQRLSPVLR